MKLCECGCGKEVSKKGNRFIHGHNAGGEAVSKRMKELHRKWKERDPEGYSKHQSEVVKKRGIECFESYKDEMIEWIKKMHRKKGRKEFYSEQMKNTRKKHPEIFKNLPSVGGKAMHRLWKEKDPKGYKQHQKQASKKALEKIRKNKPYIWDEVHFMSNEEMEVAKKLLIKPIVDVNCHIKINGKIIDFFPQKNDLQYQGCFVEYHPWDWVGRTKEEYADDRKKIIEESQYAGIPLIVLTDMGMLDKGE